MLTLPKVESNQDICFYFDDERVSICAKYNSDEEENSGRVAKPEYQARTTETEQDL
jgi:hypothetical protein